MCVLTLLYISSRFYKIHVIVSAYAWWGVSPAVRVKHMQMMTVLFSLHGVSFGVSNVKLSPIRLWSICVFVSLEEIRSCNHSWKFPCEWFIRAYGTEPPHAFDCRKRAKRNYIRNLKNLAVRNSENTCMRSGSPIRNHIRNLQSAEPLYCSARARCSISNETKKMYKKSDGVVHRNIGSDFLYIFIVSLLVNKILWNVRMRVKNCRSFTQLSNESWRWQTLHGLLDFCSLLLSNWITSTTSPLLFYPSSFPAG